MAVAVTAALLLALQVVGPFDSSLGPFDSSEGPFDSGRRPWTRDISENVVRSVHRGPFDGRTSIWLRLYPRAADPRVAPTAFLFIAEFPGRSPRTRPPVTWQVDTGLRFYPLVQRVARLHLSIDANRPIDLLAAGEPASIGHCCDDAPPTSATIALSPERLDRLAAATTVTGDAFGVPFTLDRVQLRAIAEFRRNILPDLR
jgi:hypothetical protein